MVFYKEFFLHENCDISKIYQKSFFFHAPIKRIDESSNLRKIIIKEYCSQLRRWPIKKHFKERRKHEVKVQS